MPAFDPMISQDVYFLSSIKKLSSREKKWLQIDNGRCFASLFLVIVMCSKFVENRVTINACVKTRRSSG